jgi:hypothetical protein
LVVDEVGYLTYGTDAANMLFHVVNERHRRHRSMIFTTNKPLKAWGRVLHDEDLGQAIIDRVLERGRLIRLDGPSIRTLHLKLDEALKDDSDQDDEVARISGNKWPEFRNPQSVRPGLVGSRNLLDHKRRSGAELSRSEPQRLAHCSTPLVISAESSGSTRAVDKTRNVAHSRPDRATSFNFLSGQFRELCTGRRLRCCSQNLATSASASGDSSGTAALTRSAIRAGLLQPSE